LLKLNIIDHIFHLEAKFMSLGSLIWYHNIRKYFVKSTEKLNTPRP